MNITTLLRINSFSRFQIISLFTICNVVYFTTLQNSGRSFMILQCHWMHAHYVSLPSGIITLWQTCQIWMLRLLKDWVLTKHKNVYYVLLYASYFRTTIIALSHFVYDKEAMHKVMLWEQDICINISHKENNCHL